MEARDDFRNGETEMGRRCNGSTNAADHARRTNKRSTADRLPIPTGEHYQPNDGYSTLSSEPETVHIAVPADAWSEHADSSPLVAGRISLPLRSR
jgi:hypothetical protein